MNSRLMDQLADVLVKIGAFGLIATVAVIGWQVFGRFVLNASPSWSEQAALMMMIWYVFLVSAAGFWERFHIRIELLEGYLSARSMKWLHIVTDGLVAGVGVVFLVYGAELVSAVREHTIPSLGVSRSMAYLTIPVSGALIVLFALGQIIGRFGGED